MSATPRGTASVILLSLAVATAGLLVMGAVLGFAWVLTR